MALIALLTAGRVDPEESLDQQTKVASVDIDAGQAIHEDANGQWALALATTAANGTAVYVAAKKVRKGAGLTGIRKGVFYGFNVTGLAFNAAIYLSDTAGSFADAPGTVNILVGRVTSARAVTFGTTPDKLIKFDCPL